MITRTRQRDHRVKNRLLGGSPLLQRGELDFSPAKKRSLQEWALAQGILRGVRKGESTPC